MKTKSMTDVLKQTLRASGLTVYRVSKDTGIESATIYRFLAGRTSLRLDCADKIAAYLNLELVERKG